jgi:hypothetical protein
MDGFHYRMISYGTDGRVEYVNDAPFDYGELGNDGRVHWVGYIRSRRARGALRIWSRAAACTA